MPDAKDSATVSLAEEPASLSDLAQEKRGQLDQLYSQAGELAFKRNLLEEFENKLAKIQELSTQRGLPFQPEKIKRAFLERLPILLEKHRAAQKVVVLLNIFGFGDLLNINFRDGEASIADEDPIEILEHLKHLEEQFGRINLVGKKVFVIQQSKPMPRIVVYVNRLGGLGLRSERSGATNIAFHGKNIFATVAACEAAILARKADPSQLKKYKINFEAYPGPDDSEF
ncbi:MAG: hypothetical protein V2A63_02265 [Patescibacteria group bacterium]